MICWWGREENGGLCAKEMVEDHMPFCSVDCHEGYKEIYAPKKLNEKGKPVLSIEEMQKRLLEMARESGLRKGN